MTRKERFLAETVSYIAMAEAFAKDIRTLTVDISGLADVDGLPPNADDFTVNWQHADTIGTNIAADTRTYTLTSSDVGENLRVEVKYRDRDGTDETVVLDSWPGTGTVLDNTAPTASDGTVTMDQDTQYTFAAANFNFSDADSTDTLVVEVLHTAPTLGEKADTGFQIKFRSVAPGGGSGGASCETPQPLFASGAPR